MPRRSAISRVRKGGPGDQLRQVIAALRRRYGEHIIRTVADLATRPAATGSSALSTGSLQLDLMVGGLPRGHITEYAGANGAGKETLAFAALATCQASNGLAVLVDADGMADPDALAEAQVDFNRLVLACPTTALEAWSVLGALSRCGALDLLVLTSLPGLLALPGSAWGARDCERRLFRLDTALRGRPTALLLTNMPLTPSQSPLSAAQERYPAPALRGSAHPVHAEMPENRPSWQTIGERAIAQIATLRVAFHHTGVGFTAYGDVAALHTRATIAKYRGRAITPDVPLEIMPRGPRRAAELVALGRRLGLLTETSLGLVMRGPVRADQATTSPVGPDGSMASPPTAGLPSADRILGRTGARAVRALEDDETLAMELTARILQMRPDIAAASTAVAVTH